MHFAYALTIILLIISILLIVWLIWSYINAEEPIEQTDLNFAHIREIMINDGYLHRLLMIEILNKKEEPIVISEALLQESVNQETTTQESIIEEHPMDKSQLLTFDKICIGMALLGKLLTRTFGVAISHRIGILMNKRNEIIKDYYYSIHKKILPDDTIRKLGVVTKQITDNIASSFHICDTTKKQSLSHYQRLYNLIIMYDRELINQAKSYANQNYDTSMNCSQSALDIAQHISNEFHSIMKDSQQLLKIMS